MLTKKEVWEKYRKVPLKFATYYKYTFTFEGQAEDGAIIYYSIGGSHEDIYKEPIQRDTIRTLEDTQYSRIRIKLDEKIIYEEYPF